ncbi:unnamed protein product [Malus baccata var. baccata]
MRLEQGQRKRQGKNMIWDPLAFNPDDMRYSCSGVACLQRMSGPFDRRFCLNFGEEAALPSQDNIWRPSFLSPTGPLTVRDFVMKNDMTAAVVTRNLLTPKDNILLSKRSDELAVKDSLALSRFVGLFQRHLLLSSSGVVLRTEAPNDQPLMPPHSGVLPSSEAPNDHPLVPPLSGVLPTAKTSPEQPL